MLQKTCDEDMHKYFHRYKELLARPRCFDLYDENGPIDIKMFSLASPGTPINFNTVISTKVVSYLSKVLFIFTIMMSLM